MTSRSKTLMLTTFTAQVWSILLDLSPPLLLGLSLAGLIHAFMPRGLVRRRLSASNTKSVIQAVLVGLPLPLCSCGVTPTAIGLHREGASRGAATGFLISTPQTGVDSILVSASLLGWPFALFKVAAAFVTGVIGGLLVNLGVRDQPPDHDVDVLLDQPGSVRGKIGEALHFAVFDLLAMIDVWIVLGVVLAAVISAAVPQGYLHEVAWTQGLGGMLLALVISLPLYVCTTGSVPIAASLIAAGMPAGTALVFLMAGPATNVATMGAVYRALGGRVLAIYVGTVAAMSVLLGTTFEFVLGGVSTVAPRTMVHHGWLATASAVVLLGLLLLLLGRRIMKRRSGSAGERTTGSDLTLRVDGMTCDHCAATVKRTLESVDGLREATVDLATGRVHVRGEGLESAAVARAVEQAGYKVRD